MFTVKSTGTWGSCTWSSFRHERQINSTKSSINLLLHFIYITRMRSKLIFLTTLLILFFSASLVSQEKPAKERKTKQKSEKVSKWERRALKAEKRSGKYKLKSIKALKGKSPNMSKSEKLKMKSEKMTTKAKKMRYKGKSIRHVKVQERKTKKRMKSGLKKHRKYKNNKRNNY